MKLTKYNLIKIIKLYYEIEKIHQLDFNKLLDIFGKDFWKWDEYLEFIDYDPVCPDRFSEETYGELNGKHVMPHRTNGKMSAKWKQELISVLHDNHYNQKETAKDLGISARVVNYWVEKFGIDHPSWKRKNKRK